MGEYGYPAGLAADQRCSRFLVSFCHFQHFTGFSHKQFSTFSIKSRAHAFIVIFDKLKQIITTTIR